MARNVRAVTASRFASVPIRASVSALNVKKEKLVRVIRFLHVSARQNRAVIRRRKSLIAAVAIANAATVNQGNRVCAHPIVNVATVRRLKAR